LTVPPVFVHVQIHWPWPLSTTLLAAPAAHNPSTGADAEALPSATPQEPLVLPVAGAEQSAVVPPVPAHVHVHVPLL
jgi:hypothetical protein